MTLVQVTQIKYFQASFPQPIEAKFHVEPPLAGRTKVLSNGPGHMTKMAAMSIYGKKALKIFISGTKKTMTLKLGMQHLAL